ncbi:MAG TPA: lysylphosphatidylglycerol synthase transmembrane domain-containing protein [Acidimicrobiales bacterium]|nr:lysylphosphatidylglycerol synthase transmembrane domain-containing protein [Acidimicrobiales bacterium]
MAASSDEDSGGGTAPAATGRTRPFRSALRRSWPALRFLLAIGVLALAIWVLSSHTNELSGVPTTLEHLNWWWVPPAILAEMGSFACFAGMQYTLLKSGGLDAPPGALLKMTYASQALTNSLIGGTAVSAVYGFRWYRRFGADDTLAAWSMAGTLIASMTSLSLVATAGLALAASEGASLDLIPVIIGVMVVTASIGALFVYERPLFIVLTWGIRASQSILRRPRGDAVAHIQRIMQWVTSVHLGWRQVIRIVLWGTANWLFDCACFAMMFLAVHSAIPWKGLLLAYGAGQLAAVLPITPGGLGAVEGSITIALVAFGGAQVATVDAVLMYRIISFWLVILVGWSLWGQLAYEVRKGKWSRHALTAPIGAGPGPDRRLQAAATVAVEQPTVSGS